jgi:hypothetical protein
VRSDLGASGASTDRALRGSALSRSGPSTPGRAVPPLRGCLRNYRSSAPLQSLAHEPGAALPKGSPCASRPPMAWNFARPDSGARRVTCMTNNTLRVRSWAPPMAWNFARPCSGARRAAVVQQHAQRAVLTDSHGKHGRETVMAAFVRAR